MHKRVCTWLSLLCAAAAAFLLPGLLRLPHTATHHWLYALGTAAVFAASRALLAQTRGRLRTYALGLGFAFALCQLAGARLDAADTLGGMRAALALLACALALAPAMGAGFAWLARRAEEIRASEGERLRGGWVFWGCFAAILLAWLPMYLAYYPGMFNYDSTGEITQVLAHSYDGNFPIAHTLLLGAFYRLGEALGSYNTGIALYTALQCAALAASMAYAALYLYRLGCARWLWLGMTALFALLPTHSLMAMCTTKDLFFSAALLVLMLRLHALWRTPKSARVRDFAIIAALTALLCLMRNNGVLAILAAALGAPSALAAHERSRRRVLAALLCGVVVFGTVTAGLGAVTHPRRGGIREWLSVPLMQVARVWAKADETGEILSEDAEIRAFIPQVERYQRHLADGVKRKATVGVVNMPQFLSLWGRLFAQHPADFVDAAAYLTKGYWHLNDETHLDIYAERGNHGYLETVNQDGLGVTRQSVLPGLMERMDALFVENGYRSVPLLATVVEPAFWCWMICALVVWMAYRRDRGGLWAASLLMGLFASMLFGPCAYIRYAYPLALCAPALLGLGLARPRSEN